MAIREIISRAVNFEVQAKVRYEPGSFNKITPRLATFINGQLEGLRPQKGKITKMSANIDIGIGNLGVEAEGNRSFSYPTLGELLAQMW